MKTLTAVLALLALLLAGILAWVGARGGELHPVTAGSEEPDVPSVEGSDRGSSPELERALDALDARLAGESAGRVQAGPGGEDPTGDDPEDAESNDDDPLPGSTFRSADEPITEGFWPNGDLEYRGHQVRDENGEWVREGPWETWYEGGQRYEQGAYAQGREHGPWTWWWPNGELQAVGSFVDGERQGAWTFWHDNGEKLLEGGYHEGLSVGLWTSWHEDGSLWTRGVFSDGVTVGHWIVHHPDGSLDLDRTGLYENGEKVAD